MTPARRSEFGSGSESPMGGPVYRYDANLNSAVKFPSTLNGRFFAGEYGRRWIKAIEVTSSGGYGEISSFPWSGTQVMDMAFGPDGALYVLDYGTGNNNQALYRIEYIGQANRNPIARASSDKTSGAAPLTVNFSSAGSSDPEGGALSYSWNFGDGTTSTAANPGKTYSANGAYTATLTVRDPQGLHRQREREHHGRQHRPLRHAHDSRRRPAVLLRRHRVLPGLGQRPGGRHDRLLAGVGHRTRWATTATLTRSPRKTGCSGTIAVPVDGEHDSAANIFGVFVASTPTTAVLTSTEHPDAPAAAPPG